MPGIGAWYLLFLEHKNGSQSVPLAVSESRHINRLSLLVQGLQHGDRIVQIAFTVLLVASGVGYVFKMKAFLQTEFHRRHPDVGYILPDGFQCFGGNFFGPVGSHVGKNTVLVSLDMLYLHVGRYNAAIIDLDGRKITGISGIGAGKQGEPDVGILFGRIYHPMPVVIEEIVAILACDLSAEIFFNSNPVFQSGYVESGPYCDGPEEDQTFSCAIHKIRIKAIKNLYRYRGAAPFGRSGMVGFLKDSVIGSLTSEGILGGNKINAAAFIQQITQG